MKDETNWQYNEFTLVGKDYSKQEEVADKKPGQIYLLVEIYARGQVSV